MTEPDGGATIDPGPGNGLFAGLAAEYALIYAYGRAGAELRRGAARDAAAAAETAHRDLRDRLTEHLAAGNRPPPPPEPAYVVGAEVSGEDAAVDLLLSLEERTAATWRTAVAQTGGDDRRLALEALAGCARHAVRWRRVRGDDAVTVAFPGRV